MLTIVVSLEVGAPVYVQGMMSEGKNAGSHCIRMLTGGGVSTTSSTLGVFVGGMTTLREKG